jgi:hypothetical protein
MNYRIVIARTDGKTFEIYDEKTGRFIEVVLKPEERGAFSAGFSKAFK